MPGPFQPVAHPGILHQYTSRLTAFEHGDFTDSSGSPHHTLLFLGGLGDGYGHPRYPGLLAKHFPPNWSVVEVLLSSSYTGWTTSSLGKDADELARAVRYFRTLPGRSEQSEAKIVLMGHSTGSQICMEYLVGPWKQQEVAQSTLTRPKIDGVIIQAGISDREALSMTMSSADLTASLELARDWVREDRSDDILPNSATNGAFGAEPSAKRWLSLVGIDGDDDYFSSDLSTSRLDRTFGEIGRRKVPMCILLSGQDEYMPGFVDKQALIDKWTESVISTGGYVDGESGVVESATHNLNSNDDAIKKVFAERVARIVQRFTDWPTCGDSINAQKL